MVSLIKNQILKHLSKFAKNLSADKINVSTLKGEGELNNLELNEEVLMDLLELPFWIRLTKAICNRVTCKIMWTKLKSVPICLGLDEVLVEMETCEELRMQNSASSLPSYSSGGKYGFYDKVIDGITVTVNNIVINFKSPAFHASVQLSRICLDSRMPTWQKSDLRMTRLKEPDKGQILIFKQLEWQTLRVEAMATSLQEQFSTPLRLITNQARCRITIKKSLSDCSIIGSRLVLILDDLLWVLTDSQLKAALHFANSLSGLIQRATELSQKTKAVRKLESLPGAQSQLGSGQSPRQQHPSRHQSVALSRVFSVHDVVETSYHLYSTQIDLHLCDEISPNEMHLSHPGLVEGGAMQVTFQNLAIDYYPYHLASWDRKNWLRYKESSTTRTTWVSSLLASFRQRLTELVQGETSRVHTPLYRTPPQSTPASTSQDQRRNVPLQTRTVLHTYMNRLMSMCIVVRVDDFTVYQVSTTSGSSKGMPQKFISSDKTRLLLPSDMTAVHLEITQYYYPGDNSIPVPSPHMHVHLNPLQITFEPLTLLWVNAFLLTLQKTQAMLQQSQPQMSTMDIRIEGLLPRIVIAERKEHTNQPDRPKQLQIQISRLILTNSRIGENCGRIELGSCLETFQQGELFFASAFPSCPGDFQPVISEFVQHSLSQDRQITSVSNEEEVDGPFRRSSNDITDSVQELFIKIKKELLWTEMKNIWCVSMDPVWVDFSGVESNKQRPIPFIDAIPLTLWVYQNPQQKIKSESECLSKERPSKKLLKEFYQDNEINKNLDKTAKQETHPKANIHILAHVQSLINVQINHYQYLFLLRTLEMIGDLTKQLAADTCLITEKEVTEVSSSCVAAFFPEFHVSLVMPVTSLDSTNKFTGTELDENTSVKSNDSIPSDLTHTPEAEKIFSTFSVLKDLSPSNKTLKDSNDKEGSVTGSIAKSCSDSLLDTHSVNNISPNDSSPIIVKSQETLSTAKIIEEDDSGMSTSLTGPFPSGYNTLPLTKSRAASVSSEWSNLDKVPDNLTRTFMTGSSAVKKGFSNIMSSIDSAISASRNSPQGLQDRLELSPEELPTLDEWETMSMKSDMSSDSDQFLMVHLENQSSRLEDTLFNIQDSGPAKVERANEMKEESPSEPSSASVKRLDLVSALTVCLGKVEYIQLSHGVRSAVGFQSNQLSIEEHGSMTWDEFQAKFSSRSRNWKETFANHSMSPCEIKFRMESYPDPHDDSQSPKDASNITAIAKNISLSLSMSSVSGFVDLIEDEEIAVPTPLHISLSNVRLHLQEDRPSPNVTSPGSVPLDAFIPNMIIQRSFSGVFEIHPVDEETNDKFQASLSHLCSRPDPCSFATYLSEIDNLKNGDISKEVSESEMGRIPGKGFLRDTAASSFHTQNLIEENKQLLLQLKKIEMLQKENDQLRDQLNVAVTRADCALERLTEVEDEVLHLREEKMTLLATRQLLQDELLALEKQQGSRFPDQNATG